MPPGMAREYELCSREKLARPGEVHIHAPHQNYTTIYMDRYWIDIDLLYRYRIMQRALHVRLRRLARYIAGRFAFYRVERERDEIDK